MNSLDTASPSDFRLETQHVFLDTQAYRALGHNPTNPLLFALARHVTDGKLVLHVTDILQSEVHRQIREWVAETTATVKKARHAVQRWAKRFEPLNLELPEFNEESVAQHATTAMELFWLSTSAVRHEVDRVRPSAIFERYFAKEPPFQAEGSKEFPDAFILLMLETWCRERDERMYVITADKAVTEAVQRSDCLLPMASIEALLSAVVAMERPDIVLQAARLMMKEAIQGEILEGISQLASVASVLVLGDEFRLHRNVFHELAGRIELGEFAVIAVQGEEIRVQLEAIVPLKLGVLFDETTDIRAQEELSDVAITQPDPIFREIDAQPRVKFFVQLTGRNGGQVLKVEPVSEHIIVIENQGVFG